MNESFNRAFEIVLRFEGGYVYDPDDPGGETKYGISKRQYPHLDIKNLTKEQAKEIYYSDYWLRAKCHLLPYGLDIYHFDTSVNVGIRRANKFLQTAINQASPTGHIVVDGIIGPKTLGMLKQLSPGSVLSEYACIRSDYYVRLAKRKSLQKFLRGWIRRSIKVFAASMLYYVAHIADEE